MGSFKSDCAAVQRRFVERATALGYSVLDGGPICVKSHNADTNVWLSPAILKLSSRELALNPMLGIVNLSIEAAYRQIMGQTLQPYQSLTLKEFLAVLASRPGFMYWIIDRPISDDALSQALDDVSDVLISRGHPLIDSVDSVAKLLAFMRKFPRHHGIDTSTRMPLALALTGDKSVAQTYVTQHLSMLLDKFKVSPDEPYLEFARNFERLAVH